MRIVMIGPFGLAPKGSMSMRALPLARELAARGHAVALVMPPWHTPQEAPRSWQEDGVHLEYVALTPRAGPLSYLLTTYRLVRRALAFQPDVIHCFKPKGYAGLAAWWLWHARLLGGIRARLVVDEDDWEGPGGWNELEPYPWWLRRVFAWQERWGLRHCDALTVASRTLQSLAWSLGAPPERVFYLPNGAKPTHPGDGQIVRDRYGLGDAPVVLLYTRFFEFRVQRAVNVFAHIARECAQARLLVVGRALFEQDDSEFDRLIEQAGLQERVRRAGWVDARELADYFAATDVALYPFDDTLVNRAKCAVKLVDLLEAGLPVVADAVGQNCEYIASGVSGLLVPSSAEGDVAQAVLQLLRDPALRARLGAAARQSMQTQYAWSTLVQTLLAAYGEA